jgi:hypothetical protein
MSMRLILLILVLCIGFLFASWPNPVFMGCPPNVWGYTHWDAEYGLDCNELYVVIFDNIYFTHRTGSTWSAPVIVPALNPHMMQISPALTGNGLRMYFCAKASMSNLDPWHIWASDKVGGVWQPAFMLPAPINSVDTEWKVAVSPNGNELYFSSNRNGATQDFDIFRSHWNGGGWSAPIRLDALCTTNDEQVCDVSSDGNKLYFERREPLGDCSPTGDLYVSTWGGIWMAPEPLTEFNTSEYIEQGATISPGDNHFIFASTRPYPGSNITMYFWESIKQVGVEPTSLGTVKASFK